MDSTTSDEYISVSVKPEPLDEGDVEQKAFDFSKVKTENTNEDDATEYPEIPLTGPVASIKTEPLHDTGIVKSETLQNTSAVEELHGESETPHETDNDGRREPIDMPDASGVSETDSGWGRQPTDMPDAGGVSESDSGWGRQPMDMPDASGVSESDSGWGRQPMDMPDAGGVSESDNDWGREPTDMPDASGVSETDNYWGSGASCVPENGTETHKEVFTCDQCHKLFYRRRYLRRHKKKMHHVIENVPVRDFKCPACPKSFKWQTSLNIHIKCKHSTESFPCPHCCNYYTTDKFLRRHVRQKHPAAPDTQASALAQKGTPAQASALAQTSDGPDAVRDTVTG